MDCLSDVALIFPKPSLKDLLRAWEKLNAGSSKLQVHMGPCVTRRTRADRVQLVGDGSECITSARGQVQAKLINSFEPWCYKVSLGHSLSERAKVRASLPRETTWSAADVYGLEFLGVET
ncbi:hypothetical protein MSAN_01341400 [Mycena sanguinolenta]|uniref:Uncharacterized protein n=1 Tax=Mycena sanguinolenta TaxID=230812 RepID=A0A8H6YAK0_9AGAR|nr:hypothetical protein MSAN_01341400 [Mycena sanguinolenta]